MTNKNKKIKNIRERADILQVKIENDIKHFEEIHNVIVLPKIEKNKIIIGLAIDVGTY